MLLIEPGERFRLSKPSSFKFRENCVQSLHPNPGRNYNFDCYVAWTSVAPDVPHMIPLLPDSEVVCNIKVWNLYKVFENADLSLQQLAKSEYREIIVNTGNTIIKKTSSIKWQICPLNRFDFNTKKGGTTYFKMVKICLETACR